jgi:hypothetical protein
MRLIMIAAAATIALAVPVLAQTQSDPSNTVGSGTAKSLDDGSAQRVGKPVTPSSQGANHKHKEGTAMNRPGAAPKNGVDKPEGTTGAPPYGSQAPNTPSTAGGEPDGG